MPTALSYPYCTLADVQAECRNSSTEFHDDLLAAINSASRYIDEHCRRDFLYHNHASTALEIRPEWVAEDTILLPWPILTLTEIKYADSYGTETVLETTNYRAEAPYLSRSGRILRSGRWFSREAYTSVGLLPERVFPMQPRILAKGTFGYAPVSGSETTAPSASIPSPVRRACTVIAAVWSGHSKKQVVMPGGGAESVTTKTVPKEAMDLLNRYAIPVL
jgi:hypothetical protein